jgi:probable phosphoglycerate mutase
MIEVSRGVRPLGYRAGVPLDLLLVRHGQSEWNALGRWQGQQDPPLSELGLQQAAHAAHVLGALDVIISSDLERAHHTALVIAERLGVGPVLVDPRLRERHAGEWQGLTRVEIEERWPGYLAERRRPPGWETDESVLERASTALHDIETFVDGSGSALVVTHGGLIYAIEQSLGAEFERLANLHGRWIRHDARGRQLGERVALVDDRLTTVPGQV